MALTQKGRQLLINTPLGEDFLLLKEFSASETISELFSFQLNLVHEEFSEGLTPTVIDPKQLLGQPVSIKVVMPDKTSRNFNGVISHWRQGNRDTRFTYYQAQVVPKVWLLTQRSQSRIFQRLNVREILKQVFTGYTIKDELVGTFNRREYCVQYQETDFDFASRLMEEEGIYYYFVHTNTEHTMILANTPLSHRDCPTKNKFPFEASMTGQAGYAAAIYTWEMAYQLQTGKITIWDHNFELPHRKLEADQPSLYPVANNSELEIYQYPGAYAKRYTGIDRGGGDQSGELQHIFEDNQQQAELQMQAIDAGYKVANGSSNCCPLTVGHKFDIFNHPAKGTDGQYMLTQLTHHAFQNPDLVTDDPVDDPYDNNFSCIPLKTGSTPFRPARKTPKSKISGSQTAVVVGPSGEEIFTDKYGRIKVQFHWDREGSYDVGSSCWMRVAQPWAGGNWGTVCIPRIGQEVVVEFLEGDPDRPLVVGALYNPREMPPYVLPAGANHMGFKSNSTKGGGGYNEMVCIDAKGDELVRIHAQYDMETTVEHDDRQTVHNDRTIEVNGHHTETVKKNMTTTVTTGHQKNTVTAGNQENTVTAGNQTNTVSAGKQDNTVNQNISITSDCGAITITAAKQIILQVGANKIVIDETGVISVNSTNKITTTSGGVTVIKGSEVDIN